MYILNTLDVKIDMAAEHKDLMMDESLRATGSEASSRLTSRGQRQPRHTGSPSEHSKRSDTVDNHSAVARTDELAWSCYFCEQQRGMFVLFQSIEMYEAYVHSQAKAVDSAVATEREDQRARERWETLRQAFTVALEKVLVKKEIAKKAEATKGEIWVPTLPFRAVRLDAALGSDLKIARVYVKAEGLFPRRRKTKPVLRVQEPDDPEHLWRLHRVHKLRINRKQRSTKHDSLDILEEEAA